MAKERLPWKLRASDFNRAGWHTRPTVGFELMFEFLRLSPSYELARKANEEALTAEDRARLPPDFDVVLKTYALLGNVQAVLFRTWWLQRGLKVFGNPHARPNVHQFGRLPNGIDVAINDVAGELDHLLAETRRDEGLGPAILISVPLGRRKSEVLKQIARLLDEHSDMNADAPRPQLALQGKRLRAKVLFNGIRLLWMRAAKPKWELWRLGAKARLSTTYSPVLDPDAPRRVSDYREMTDREMMGKITHRALMKFEATAENAARGRFPSDQSVAQIGFDYPKLAKIIQGKNRWETKEKARLLNAFEASKIRRSAR